jgi:hypothetical protein
MKSFTAEETLSLLVEAKLMKTSVVINKATSKEDWAERV